MDIDKIEMYAGRGLNKEQVAQCLGISRRVFFKYQEENPEFAEAYDRGRAKATAVIAGKLLQKVETGSLVAIIFWLKCQAGWKETGVLEIPGLTPQAAVDFETLTPEQKRAAYEEMLKGGV